MDPKPTWPISTPLELFADCFTHMPEPADDSLKCCFVLYVRPSQPHAAGASWSHWAHLAAVYAPAFPSQVVPVWGYLVLAPRADRIDNVVLALLIECSAVRSSYHHSFGRGIAPLIQVPNNCSLHASQITCRAWFSDCSWRPRLTRPLLHRKGSVMVHPTCARKPCTAKLLFGPRRPHGADCHSARKA